MGKNTVQRLLKPAVPAVLMLAALAASYFRVFDNFEALTLDTRFVLRPAKAVVSDKIAIIEISEDTVAKLGRFPFDRQYHAIIINALTEFGARAIVIDLLFSAPQEHDAELAEAVAQSGRTYLACALDIDNAGRSDIVTAKGYAAECLGDLAKKAKGVGHINAIPDPDGKFRRISPYISYKDRLYPNLSFLAACDYLGVPKKDIELYPGRYLNCGRGLIIPLDEKSNIIVNYSGKWGEVFKHYSYVDVLQSYMAPAVGDKPILNPELFKDKICVVGLTTLGMDIHPSPFEPIYPGCGIHAEILKSIINKDFIARVSRWINLAVLVFLCALIAAITLITKPIKGLIALIIIGSSFVASCLALFDIYGLWLDIVCPLVVMILLYLSLMLYKYISEWKNRLRSEYELGTAKTIQQSFLPKKVPQTPGMDIAAAMFTARQVGGDLYEFIEFEDGRLGVMIGDVSGKGIPASLFMAMVMGEFRCFVAADLGPREVISRLNAKLVKESASNLFVTMFYTVFDLKGKSLEFANGGHLPLLLLRKGKESEFLDVEEGAPLGLLDGDYSGRSANFNKGDIFIFYTDGITEAMNNKREMYGKERLAAVAKRFMDLPAKDILENIEKDVRRFEPKSTQHDDMTIIVAKLI
jgi:CHASE2 domain-containing sensor protein